MSQITLNMYWRTNTSHTPCVKHIKENFPNVNSLNINVMDLCGNQYKKIHRITNLTKIAKKNPLAFSPWFARWKSLRTIAKHLTATKWSLTGCHICPLYLGKRHSPEFKGMYKFSELQPSLVPWSWVENTSAEMQNCSRPDLEAGNPSPGSSPGTH